MLFVQTLVDLALAMSRDFGILVVYSRQTFLCAHLVVFFFSSDGESLTQAVLQSSRFPDPAGL